MLVPSESSSAVLVTMSNKSVFICNRSHARRVHNRKIMISVWRPAARNLVTNKLEILRWKPGVTWAWFGTGTWQTDKHPHGQRSLYCSCHYCFIWHLAVKHCSVWNKARHFHARLHCPTVSSTLCLKKDHQHYQLLLEEGFKNIKIC